MEDTTLTSNHSPNKANDGGVSGGNMSTGNNTSINKSNNNSNQKKKIKKWLKKVEKGDVHTIANYLICRYSYNLLPVPSVQYNTDKTRAKSEYNLLLSELRDFLLALYYNEQQIQKNFEVKNRAYIRYVISIHLSDLDEGLASAFSFDKVNVIKISRQVDSVSFLPQKLLTIPFENCSEEELLLNPAVDCNQLNFLRKNEDHGLDLSYETKEHLWKQLNGYVATPAHLRLWNFPLPLEIEQEENPLKRQKVNEIDQSKEVEEEDETALSTEELQQEEAFTTNPDHSKDFIPVTLPPSSSSSLEQIGLHLLPSITEVSTLQSSPTFQHHFPFHSVQYFHDFPKNENPHILSHFLQSVDYPSSAYDALFLSPSSFSPLMIAAIDCEMCETSNGLEVTRVTVLDHDSKVILDVLVKPDHPIIDYRTTYSGITEAMLQPITTRLIQIQILLLRFICSQTILIGHSLENDLKVLHFIHMKIIDTTLLYPHPQGFPYRSKLRYLAKEYLQLSIQQPNNSLSSSASLTKKEIKEQALQVVKGHDSQEDASATLKLVLLKMNKGPLFGLPSSMESEALRVPITKRLSYLKIPSLLVDYHPNHDDKNGNNKDGDNNSSQQQQQQHQEKHQKQQNENHFLENLVCQGSSIVKCHSFENILQTMESFVISHQCPGPNQEKSKNEEAIKGKKRSLPKEEGDDDDDDEPGSTDQIDQQHFIHCTIPYQPEKKEEIQNFFQQLQSRLKVSLPSTNNDHSASNNAISTHGLLLITSQRPLQQIQQLIEKREKIFSNQKRMTSMIWTSEDEEKLKYLIKENSLGNVAFQIL